MFPSSMFKIFVLQSVFSLQVVTDSDHHRGHQTPGDVPLSLDSHPGLVSRNSFTEASPLLLFPTNEDDALLPERFASNPRLDDGGSVGSIIEAESDGCSSTATQLSDKMRRVKREKGICDAIQGTKKSDPTTRPGQQQRGRQEDDGGTTPSSKNSPSPPLAQPFRSGGADELCLSFGSYYRVCAPAYRESRTVFITLNLDQCRPCMSISAIFSPFSPHLNRQKVEGRLVMTNKFLCD